MKNSHHNKSGFRKGLLFPWFGAGLCALFLLWEWAARSAGSDLILPGPRRVLICFLELCRAEGFLPSLGGSFIRVTAGMVIAAPLGLVLGIVAGLDKRALAFLRPLFSVVAATPVMAVILIAFLWLGVERTPVFTAFLMVFPVVSANTIEGLRGVDPRFKELFSVFNIPGPGVLKYLYIPSITPFILAGLKSSLSLCWKVVVAAEVLVQPLRALGTGMQRAKAQLETPELFAWTAAAVLAASFSQWGFSSARACYGGQKKRARKKRQIVPVEAMGEITSWENRAPGPAAISRISLNGLSFGYGEKAIFRELSLELGAENPLVILGPSGCGKTTLLKLLAGLLKPRAGDLRCNKPGGGAMVFQEDRLLPWLGILENLMLPLEKILPRAEAERRALDFLRFFSLEDKIYSYPGELSGGQKQRAAMARAFAYPSPVLLMDEPFQSLDIPLRMELMEKILLLLEKEERLVIAVTHDPREAVYLGKRILVLGASPGETGEVVLDELVTLAPEERELASPRGRELEKRLIQALRTKR